MDDAGAGWQGGRRERLGSHGKLPKLNVIHRLLVEKGVCVLYGYLVSLREVSPSSPQPILLSGVLLEPHCTSTL